MERRYVAAAVAIPFIIVALFCFSMVGQLTYDIQYHVVTKYDTRYLLGIFSFLGVVSFLVTIETLHIAFTGRGWVSRKIIG